MLSPCLVGGSPGRPESVGEAFVDQHTFRLTGGISRLQPNGFGHLSPTQVFLPHQSAQTGRGHGQGAVIQEPGHVLDTLPGVPAEFGCRVAKDMKARGKKTTLGEVASEAAVEGGIQMTPIASISSSVSGLCNRDLMIAVAGGSPTNAGACSM